MPARVILHVGAHKTASTHLQQTINAHAAALEADGILFMGPAMLRGADYPLGRLLSRPHRPPNLQELMREEAVRLRQENRRIFLSEENILGPTYGGAGAERLQLYPQAVPRLRIVIDTMGLSAPEVLIAVRDPAPHLVSSYCQCLFGGTVTGFGGFAKGLDPTALCWSELVERILSIRRVSSCTVWRHEDYPQILPQILERALPEGWAERIAPAEGTRHPGLSERAMRQVMEWHRDGTGPEGRSLAIEARALFPKSDQEPAYAPLAPDVLAASARAYAEDLERLAANPRVRLLEPVGAAAE